MSNKEPIPVADFLESSFVTRYLENANPQTIAKYRCVVGRAADFLGHTLQTDELCDDLINTFSDWLIVQGMSKDRCRVYRQCLRGLAADMQKDGYKTGWVYPQSTQKLKPKGLAIDASG